MYKVRYHRELKKLTQEQLAKKVGMTQSQICKIENGDRDLKARELTLFSKALETTTQELLEEEVTHV
ncbi:MAG: helix-turn-helix transcriptional regulator [Cellulosilyticaceae bacterium]